MRTIYRYDCNAGILMPRGAVIRHVGLRPSDGSLSLWAEVDTEEPLVMREFSVYGTGHEIRTDFHQKYVGTYFDGPFVFHVYEEF